MSCRTFAAAALLCAALFPAGCHRIVLSEQRSGPADAPLPVEHRAHLFAFGAIGGSEIDLTRTCPGGIGAVEERVTWRDALYGIASVGFYTPRTLFVACAPSAAG